jgi:hypothetical protein
MFLPQCERPTFTPIETKQKSISLFRCLSCTKESVQVRGFVLCFITWYFFTVRRATPCRLSSTAYSMYSQLHSILGGRYSIRSLRTRHAVVTGTHLSWNRNEYQGYLLGAKGGRCIGLTNLPPSCADYLEILGA